MRVLVTGGAGFIGQHVARRLLGSGHDVAALDCLLPQVHRDPDAARAAFPGPVLVRDVSDPDAWADPAAMAHPDVVVHLAAETGTGQSMYEAERYRRVNVEGTRLAAGHAVAHDAALVVVSSRAVYGEGAYGCPEHGRTFGARCCSLARPLASTEDDPHRPVSVYGETKSAAERVAAQECAGRVPITVIRPQNVIGPGQALHNPYTGVLAAFLAMLRDGRPLTVYGDGHQTRDFVHVDDLAALLAHAVARPPSPGAPLVLNSGTGVRTSLVELAHLAGAAAPAWTDRRHPRRRAPRGRHRARLRRPHPPATGRGPGPDSDQRRGRRRLRPGLVGPPGGLVLDLGGSPRRARTARAHLVSRPNRVLVLSPVFHGYWASLERALAARGHDVRTVTYDDRGPVARVAAKLTHELPERMGADDARRRAATGRRARAAVLAHDPDVVLVVKGDAFDDDFWDLLDRRRQRRALWLYDELRRTGHSPRTLAAAGPVASYSPHDVATLAAQGLRSLHVPLAHDPAVAFTPRPSGEVVFVGARYPAREVLLAALQRVRRAGAGLRTGLVPAPLGPRPHLARGPPRGTRRARPPSCRGVRRDGRRPGGPQRPRRPGRLHDANLRGLRGGGGAARRPGRRLRALRAGHRGARSSGRPRRRPSSPADAATDHAWAEGLRAAGRARTLAEHTFSHRAAALESLWSG